MDVSIRIGVALISLWSLLVAPARAADGIVQLVELGDPVKGHADLSYADLLRQIIPDLTSKEATGHLKAPLRHLIEGSGGVLGDTVSLSGVQVLPFRAGGKPLLAILAGVGQVEDVAEQPAMLAVFDMSGKPEFLDAADVGADRFTGFAQVPKVAIGENSEALAIYSEHFNAGEVFGATLLTFVHERKLRLVDAVYTYGLQLCATRTSQTVSFAGTPEKQAVPYYCNDRDHRRSAGNGRRTVRRSTGAEAFREKSVHDLSLGHGRKRLRCRRRRDQDAAERDQRTMTALVQASTRKQCGKS